MIVCDVCGGEKMKKFVFEIQACIKCEVEAENKEVARMSIIDNLDDYADRMIEDCNVSDGKELTE